MIERPVERVVERLLEVPVERVRERLVEVPVERVVEKITYMEAEPVFETRTRVVQVPPRAVGQGGGRGTLRGGWSGGESWSSGPRGWIPSRVRLPGGAGGGLPVGKWRRRRGGGFEHVPRGAVRVVPAALAGAAAAGGPDDSNPQPTRLGNPTGR